MVATRGRSFKRPWRRSCLSSKLKSSSAPIGRKDSWCFHAVGSSNAPLLGSTAAEGLPRIGRTSIATRWRSCGLPQSASCSENFVIPPDVFGQTLSHDGLWVFANRILANRIFAHRVLADWRRRHRGRLLARQIGGSGNAQHGDEPSRYDYDDLHDADPLVLGTRTGRPSDAPIPLCLGKTPASTIPRSGSIAGRNGSRLFVALAMDWFKCD